MSHRGAIAYVTEHSGLTAYIPKQIGQLANIKPRSIDTPGGVRLERPTQFGPIARVSTSLIPLKTRVTRMLPRSERNTLAGRWLAMRRRVHSALCILMRLGGHGRQSRWGRSSGSLIPTSGK